MQTENHDTCRANGDFKATTSGKFSWSLVKWIGSGHLRHVQALMATIVCLVTGGRVRARGRTAGMEVFSCCSTGN